MQFFNKSCWFFLLAIANVCLIACSSQLPKEGEVNISVLFTPTASVEAPTRTPNMTPLPPSVLEPILIRKTDYSSDWRWINDYEGGRVDPEDSQIVDKTMRGLSGIYGPEQYLIQFIHFVELRHEPLSPEQIKHMVQEKMQLTGAEVPIKLTSSSDHIESECIRGQNTSFIECDIVTSYGNMISFLRVSADFDIEPETLEKIANEALSGIEEHITQVDVLP